MNASRRLIIALAAFVALLGCHENRVSPDSGIFEDASRRVLEKSRTAVERASEFRQTDVLTNAPAGRYDVRSVRFAERPGDAVLASSHQSEDTGRPTESAVWRWSSPSDQGRSVSAEERLRVELEPISSRSLGALSLRAAALAQSPVWLRIELGRQGGQGGVAIRVDLVSDGALHEYVVDLRGALDRLGDDSIETLVVGVGSGAQASIKSVDVLARTWKSDETWGVTSERIGGETRSGVYLKGSGSLSWPVDGVWGDARLSFALAEMVPGRRVWVRVELEIDRSATLLTAVEVVGGDPWRDYQVELGEVDLDGARLKLTVEELGDSGVEGVVFWGEPVLWEPAPNRLNVLLLLEDALRADRMSIYGHDRATTPFKVRFFADGVRFNHCISQTTKTRFSCPSFLTSLRPLATGVYGVWNRNPRLDESYVTLAEIFKSRGWATASFLQNSNAGPDNGLDQGFERVVENIPGRADAVYGGQVLDWMEAARDRNFFGYLHVADPHAPYQPATVNRNWYEAILLESGGPQWSDPIWLQGVRRALYDGEVAGNDAALPELIHALQENGLLENTLIVFIADHGEHLGEHDLWDHIPPSYMQVVHVPMLMRFPSGTVKKTVIEQPVQLVDLMPTILDLADIDALRLPLQGRSLMPLIMGSEGEVSVEMTVVQEAMLYQRADDPKAVGSLVWDRWHFLHSDKVPSALFDFRADPAEGVPLAPSRAFEDQAMELLLNLRQLDDELRQAQGSESSAVVEIDLDNIANLKALGYLDE